jgi:hypothetical protein
MNFSPQSGWLVHLELTAPTVSAHITKFVGANAIKFAAHDLLRFPAANFALLEHVRPAAEFLCALLGFE